VLFPANYNGGPIARPHSVSSEAKEEASSMRALVFGSLFFISFAACQAQEQAGNGKIEMTYSLNGADMYKTWCASCHGTAGKGDGPAASALKKTPADLTLLTKKNAGKFPVERVRNYIEGKSAVDAHGSREMPVWGNVFEAIDASQAGITFRVVTLTTYLQTLQAK
jgi:mono/diheme cytochrome c family protein